MSLQETNTLNELKPASDEKRTLSSDDDDEHFKDIHFPPDSALQQVGLSKLILLLLFFNFITFSYSLHLFSSTLLLSLTLQGWVGTV